MFKQSFKSQYNLEKDQNKHIWNTANTNELRILQNIRVFPLENVFRNQISMLSQVVRYYYIYTDMTVHVSKLIWLAKKRDKAAHSRLR